MTEILVDADFGHPPERVWRALTDRRVLSDWLMQTDFEPREGMRFALVPDGLPGLSGSLEGEVIEVVPPSRLVMLWRGEELHCRVVWELEPITGGCRLRTSHTGFLGIKGSLRRKELQGTYERLLTERLPAALARLAANDGDLVAAGSVAVVAKASSGGLRREAPVAVRGVPPQVPASDEDTVGSRAAGLPRLSYRRRGQLLAAVGAVVLAVLTAAVIGSLGVPGLSPPAGGAPDGWPFDQPGAGQDSPGAVPVPVPASDGPVGAGGTGTTSGPGAGPTGVAGNGPLPPGAPVPPGQVPGQVPPPGPAPSPTPPEAASTVVWHAAFRTIGNAKRGYKAEIRVTNVGSVTRGPWSVVVTLGEGDQVAKVKEAEPSQSGRTVTFTPGRGNGQVEPGKTVIFRFDVESEDSTAPDACVIDGRACGGL